MPMPFQPQQPTVVVDTGRLLPEDAYRTIGHNLSNGDVSKEVLLTQARMMYSKLCEAEAKLMQANRKLGIYQKQFHTWVNEMRTLRAPGKLLSNNTTSKEVADDAE